MLCPLPPFSRAEDDLRVVVVEEEECKGARGEKSERMRDSDDDDIVGEEDERPVSDNLGMSGRKEDPLCCVGSCDVGAGLVEALKEEQSGDDDGERGGDEKDAAAVHGTGSEDGEQRRAGGSQSHTGNTGVDSDRGRVGVCCI
jgi:hypothetical protein